MFYLEIKEIHYVAAINRKKKWNMWEKAVNLKMASE